MSILVKSQCVTKKTFIKKPKFPVIDIHTHMGKLVLGNNYEGLYNTDEYVEKLKEYGVIHTVNLDGVWGSELDSMLKKVGPHTDTISTFVWIDVTKIDDDNFDEWVVNHLEASYAKGCKGIKMWKVISLNQKDKSGNYIRTDDPRLSIVYKTAARLNIPVLIHIADPVAFFEPVDEYNERYEELSLNPSWQFGKEGQMSFHELMEMQDNMIEYHPDTKFIIAHFGSYAENVEHVAKRMEKYPNMYVDIAARIAELGRTPRSTREFMIKFQDRVLFGTDETPLDFEQYPICYRFLESDDEYFPYWPEGETPGQGEWYIYGIYLPDDVLEKIYNKNAQKILNL